jgi:hypothetical protein
MDRTQTFDMKVARHFTILVYPFRHALLGRKRRGVVQQIVFNLLSDNLGQHQPTDPGGT